MNEPTPKTDNPFREFLAKQEAMRKKLLGEVGLDFERSVKRFDINKAEQAAIDAWYESLKPEIMELQNKNRPDPLGTGEPYYGAVGGGLSYTFTPTGLGDILTVTETTTGKMLNVTDALDWYFYG